MALSLTLLSGLEHFKSRRPSVLLCVFLFFTLLFDIARCRTLWLVHHDAEDGHSRTLASLFSSRVAIKTALVVLEALGRRKWLGPSASTHSPEEMTSIFGLALFTWIYRLLGRGYRSPLKTDDLYPLDQSLHVKGRFYGQAPRQQPNKGQQGKNDNQRGNASLLFEAVGTGLFQPVLPRVCLIGLKFCQPLFLHTLLNFLQDASGGTGHEQDNQSYGLIGASILIYLGLAVSTSMYWYFQDRALTVLRGFLVTSIYQKTAQVKSDINGDGAPVTLMSTDVERVCTGLRFGHETWASLIEVAIACWLLHGELGNAFLAPLVVVLLSFGASFFISKLSGKYQKVWMQYIQARVGLTSSFLSNLKQLRIGGLSGLVAETVQQKRVEELSKGGNFRTIIAFTAALSQAPGIVSPVVAFAFAFGPLGNPAATTTAFTSLSYIMLLAAPLQWLLQSIPQITASLACLDRIRDYLNAPSWQDSRESAAKEESAVQVLSEPEAVSEKQDDSLIVRSFSTEDRPAIQILDGTFAWKEQENPVLRNINIIVPRSSITLVTGPMASGKSTLCKAILGEVPVANGRVIVNTSRTTYCDQDPFLWNGTIKENIIGCSSYVSSRYEEAVEASALAIDLKNLTDGDQTRVGSKGSSLSGGQKQRVCLARALYQHADLLVFDDVFKGLDSKTQRHIWRCVFGSEGILRQRGASVVLCTHATEFLRFADHIIRLGSQDSQGTIESQGPPSQILSDVEKADSAADPDSFGSASSSLSQQQLSDDDSPPLSEEKEPSARKKEALPSPKSPKSAPTLTTADSAVYKHYASSVGPLPLLLFALLAVIVGFCTVFPTIWIKYWTDDVVRTEPRHGFPFYIGIFALLAACALACNLPAGIVTMRVMVRLSGSRLHQETLNTITHASLGFLTRTDTGVVLNHFSQDMTIVDTQLPGSLTNLGIVMSVFIGQAVVIATSSAYLAISYPLLLALLYAVQKFYLPTSKRLRLLDLENKSPLYTHFLDTVSGIVTLRAYGWLPQHAKINHDFLDTSQRPYYLLAMVQQWLTLAMNLIVLILAVLLVALATQLRAQPGFAGAGLVSLINFGTLLTGIITAYTTLEVSLGGIARLKHFSEATEQEDSPGEDHVPGREWPSTGSIEIRDVSAGYNYESEKDSLGAEEGLALKHINLSVRAGEKVALCGRTGRLVSFFRHSVIEFHDVC